MTVYFPVSDVLESVARHFVLMNKMHGVSSVDSSRDSLGESANFVAVTLAPDFFVFGALHQVTIFQHVPISVHHCSYQFTNKLLGEYSLCYFFRIEVA